MSTPVLHLLAGPNGSGKTTFFETVLGPVTGLLFVNADLIAAERWPGAEPEHGLDASKAASAMRSALFAERRSFVSETVFSHPSKVELVEEASAAGYLVTMHVMIVPEDLAVARVSARVDNGGHFVPEDRIRARHRRLWPLVATAISLAHEAFVYDTTRPAQGFRLVAQHRDGVLVGRPAWPSWAPTELTSA